MIIIVLTPERGSNAKHWRIPGTFCSYCWKGRLLQQTWCCGDKPISTPYNDNHPTWIQPRESWERKQIKYLELAHEVVNMWHVNSSHVHYIDCRNGKQPDGHEPRRTSLAGLFSISHRLHWFKISTPQYGSHCEEVPVSGAITNTGNLAPALDSGGSLFFIYF